MKKQMFKMNHILFIALQEKKYLFIQMCSYYCSY